ncbi:ATP-binding cassette domain-containing protein [Flaviaesturariibacter amylovorans]|uniref:ATP-binding cassette domain-containing protein n=1 Tax=Flaviaesturariibacter amylovorans TaxID=1084520 RepID=A0ABP8GF36_9BACT
MDQQPLIRTTGLSYRYSRDVQTLSGINLHVERGSIYGFLGPNGSGKTTTLSLLLGLLNNQAGDIEIFGQHLHRNREAILGRIGSLIETPSLYGHLTARENLEVYRSTYGASKARIDEVLDIVGLGDTGRKVAKKFSLGMKQRLAIALALLPAPELLILDEPSNGLDPAGIIELRALVKKLNREHGMTILISSHLLGEIEKMVSHVGIIYKGKMQFQGTLAGLHGFQRQGARLHLRTSDNEAARLLLGEYAPRVGADGLHVAFENNAQVAAINRRLTGQGIDVFLLHPKESDLEQLFIDLTTAHA